MGLDPGLLAEARAAETRLIDAERDVDVARAEFHRSVRRLQLAGASLREIASALGLSHQRVHQIVEGAGGARGWRGRRGKAHSGRLSTCSFCGKERGPSRLIAGPGVHICDDCVTLAAGVIETGAPAATPVSAVSRLPVEATTARCSFCGKRRHQVTSLAAAAGGTICAECLALCREILAEKLS